MEYDANVQASYDGMNEMAFLDCRGSLFRARHGTWGLNYSGKSVAYVGPDPQEETPAQYPLVEGAHRYVAIFQDGMLSYTCTRLSDGIELFSINCEVPSLDIQSVTRVGFAAYATTEATSWVDNIALTIEY